MNSKINLSFIGVDNGASLIMDASRVRDNSYILSMGLRDDFSFDGEMLKLNDTVKVVGFDPTEVSRDTYNRLKDLPHMQNRFIYEEKAVVGSSLKKVNFGGPAISALCVDQNNPKFDAVNIHDVLEKYPNTSVLKMDIEGSEFEIFESLSNLNVDQLLVGWHHWLASSKYSGNHWEYDCDYTAEDTVKYIKKIQSFGYELIHVVATEEFYNWFPNWEGSLVNYPAKAYQSHKSLASERYLFGDSDSFICNPACQELIDKKILETAFIRSDLIASSP
ncbi:MAG: FkbM family methyltransferase [Proteobacteria bacterium]|nr:FkbM family methyltransferase [Pseudomonadota bacterium]